MTEVAEGLKAEGTFRKRLQETDIGGGGEKRVEMEDGDGGPRGSCNLVGGSDISQQQCHRHKHTNRHPGMTVASERWSVRGKYSIATGTNTYCLNMVSGYTAYNKLYNAQRTLGVSPCGRV